MSKSYKYKVVQYSKQASQSPGVAAGMWAVVETVERDFAFADDRAQAERIKKAAEVAAGDELDLR